MDKIYVPLSRRELDLLERQAVVERRTIPDQAAVLLVEALAEALAEARPVLKKSPTGTEKKSVPTRTRLVIEIADQVFEVLREVAIQERRSVRDQAAVLLEELLIEARQESVDNAVCEELLSATP